jgi:hypothetical protein
MLRSDETLLVNNDWDGSNYVGIKGSGPDDNQGIGQSFQLASQKTISRIRLKGRKWLGDVTGTLTLFVGTPTSPGATVGVATLDPNNYADFGAWDFIFENPITIPATTTYSFTVDSDVQKTGGNVTYPLQFAINNSGGYASGSAYLLWHGSWASQTYDLDFEIYEQGNSTTVTYSNYTVDNMMKRILDYAASRGSRITYTPESIDNFDILIPSFTFNTNTVDEALAKCLELAQSDAYMYMDFGKNIFHAHARPTVPSRYAIRDRNTTKLNVIRTLERLVNEVWFSGGDTGGGVNLFVLGQDTTSRTNWRPGLLKKSDSRVTDATTAGIQNQVDIDRGKDPQYSGSLELVEDDDIWLEEVELGELFGFLDFDDIINNLSLQAMSIGYTPDKLSITIDSLLPKLTKRAEDLRRELQLLQNKDNPSSPS